MRHIVVGSRDSRLAVIQSELIIESIRHHYPDVDIELVTMKTTGDRILDRTLDEIGGKGLFVKELDHALIEGRADITVHSLKDMPMDIPDEIPVIGYSRREDPRDVLVLPEGASDLDPSLPVGTSSLRRSLQFRRLYPEMETAPVRGNVLTRLRKLDEGQYSGLILAAAGLRRLGLEDRISRYFTCEEMIPSAGQGILAVQGRKGEDYSYLDGVLDYDARTAAAAERAFVRELDGGCSSPVCAHAECDGDRIRLMGLYYDEESGQYITGTCEGSRQDAKDIGRKLAAGLRAEFRVY